MTNHAAPSLSKFVSGLRRRNPGRQEFVRAVQEVITDVLPHIAGEPNIGRWQILRRIAQLDRVISFRAVWQNDKGDVCVHPGWRVQHAGGRNRHD